MQGLGFEGLELRVEGLRFRVQRLGFRMQGLDRPGEHVDGRERVALVESCTVRYSSRFKNSCFSVMRSSSEEGSYSRLVDFCITQL